MECKIVFIIIVLYIYCSVGGSVTIFYSGKIMDFTALEFYGINICFHKIFSNQNTNKIFNIFFILP